MKLMIVDDHVLFMEGLASLFDAQPDIEVVAKAGTAMEAIQLAHERRPEVILMDFGLPDLSGVEATQAILAELPDAKIIFLTVYDTDERLFAAIRSGAKGYLLKNLPMAKLLVAIRQIMNNEAALSRTMTRRILEEFSRLSPPQPRSQVDFSTLTHQELAILRELARDSTNQEIASRLYLAESTVKNYIYSIFIKLGFKNRREAAQFARQQGLVKLPLEDSYPRSARFEL